MRLLHSLGLAPVNPDCDGTYCNNDSNSKDYKRGEHLRLHFVDM
jgi:hypothetical protein